MAACTAFRVARRGVALAVVTAAVVVVGAAAAAWGAPAGGGMPTAATGGGASAAAAVPTDVASKVVAVLDDVDSLWALKQQWVKPAAKKWVKPAAKKWVKPAAKQPFKKPWVKPAAKAQAPKSAPPPPSSAGPACSPLKLYLTLYYTIAWRLAMLDATATRAFGIWATARSHAAAYVASHPKTPTTVCGLHNVTPALSLRATAIVEAHRARQGALPPHGHFRNMNGTEKAAMARVLAVPLRKAVPQYLLPKRVPMTL